jgi:hypothetical protein
MHGTMIKLLTSKEVAFYFKLKIIEMLGLDIKPVLTNQY